MYLMNMGSGCLAVCTQNSKMVGDEAVRAGNMDLYGELEMFFMAMVLGTLLGLVYSFWLYWIND